MTAEATRPSLIGARIARVNDPRLLTGGGRFVDDIHLDGMVDAHVLRATLPAGTISHIDASALHSQPECDLILHALDDHGLANIPCVWTQPGQRQTSYPVLEPVVRYVGQPIGIVVAASRELAEDLAELVEVVYEEAPVVRDAAHGLEADAPLVNPETGSNLCVELARGCPWEEVAPSYRASRPRRAATVQDSAGRGSADGDPRSGGELGRCVGTPHRLALDAGGAPRP